MYFVSFFGVLGSFDLTAFLSHSKFILIWIVLFVCPQLLDIANVYTSSIVFQTLSD